MDVFTKLSETAQIKPYHGFGKLNTGYHDIKLFKYVKNKYGKKSGGPKRSILVELEKEVLFLPQHFSEKISEEDMQYLYDRIEEGKPVYLFFGGKIGESK